MLHLVLSPTGSQVSAHSRYVANGRAPWFSFFLFFFLLFFFFFLTADKTEDLGDKLNDAFEGAADWGKEQLGTYCHALISLFCDTATPVERISASLLLIY